MSQLPHNVTHSFTLPLSCRPLCSSWIKVSLEWPALLSPSWGMGNGTGSIMGVANYGCFFSISSTAFFFPFFLQLDFFTVLFHSDSFYSPSAFLHTSEVMYIYLAHLFLPIFFHFLILFTNGPIPQFLEEENKRLLFNARFVPQEISQLGVHPNGIGSRE